MNLKYNILIVDDVRENIKVAMNILRENNYNFSFATSGKQALEIVKIKNFDLILLDIMMPELSGFDVIEILKNNVDTKEIPVIFLTAKADIDSLDKGFKLGAADYITKPFNSTELLARVANHLEFYRAKVTLKQNNIDLGVKIQRSQERFISELESNQQDIIHILTAFMASASDETGKHLDRVSKYSKLLATLHDGINDQEIGILHEASRLHDIGKITIPHNILHKSGKLTAEEFDIMKTHTTKAHEVLSSNKRELSTAAGIIAHQHHENWDGSGYPNGLKGDGIHIYGRVVAVADVLDALTHERAYKNAWSFEDASEFIIKQSGTKFDPALIELFKENIDKFKIIATD